MKTLNTIIAVTLLTLGSVPSADAQVTITANGLFTIGSRYQVGVDESAAATPGNNGTDLSWNFSTLNADVSKIVDVRAPQNSPFGTQLAGNRAVVENNDEAAEYITVSPTQLLSHGRVFEEEGVQVPLALDPPMVVLNLPAQYYQNHSGVSRTRVTSYLGMDIGLGFVVDSIRIRSHLAYLSEVGGWGTVITPLGTFEAIKQYLQINGTDSIDFYRADQELWLEGVDVSNSTERSWSWWTSDHNIPVFKLSSDEDGDTGYRAEWIEADLNTTSINDHTAVDGLVVFPNPAIDQVTVALEGFGMATYSIHDVSGKRVQEGRLTADRPSIPVMHLERGTYTLRVEEGGTLRHAKLFLQ